MNAAEQATSIEFASKIATVVRLFKVEFPDLRVDLKPWTSDQDTRDLVDPDSIDIGLHFPGVSRLFHCRSLLLQIRFYDDPDSQDKRVIGMEIGGYDHRGKQWTFSTIHRWRFTGETVPEPAVGDRLKKCCQQVFEVFSNSLEESA
ncbi:hypothetical protein DYY88_04330 [Leptolyngbya iicbica LK]|uniref:Uncharacterized protein n=2 Tax=Cyanophyceae TaxID=3028117 RepID=A0A4Q7EF43_9CYAN|nr:hypothetical protein [Leptolyngbya sp. LK]RZM82474.1 hypothetical protein DYY88_04330 [Leptolyngbya sp. LK]